MRCVQKENVQEHSFQVAVVAHALAVIKNKYYGGAVDPENIATMALFHDATEVITGDLPTPVKYFSQELRTAYKAIEGHAAVQLLQLLPEDMRGDYRDLVKIPFENRDGKEIIKAADLLCAYIKCLEERAAGNNEFSRAQKSIESRLLELRSRPEVGFFIDRFVPSFTLTLDEMSDPLQI